ncbi:MAG: cell division protein SepF, partial [Coprobacillus sp.]
GCLMGYGQKVKKWFFEEDDDGDDVYEDVEIDTEEEPEVKTTSMFEKAKSTKTSDAVKALSANKDSHLVLFEPRAYSETQEIAIYLKQKRAAVVNLHRLQKEQSKRVIDFLSGVIFAIEGDIQQIGPKIFLCTPKNIGVSGNITMDSVDTEE